MHVTPENRVITGFSGVTCSLIMQERSSKFVLTQNNPHKWLRKEDDRLWNKDPESYSPEEIQTYLAGIPSEINNCIKYAVFALEQGESGTYHIQGFILLKKQQRTSFLWKAFPKGDVKPARGTIQQASSYPGNPDFEHTDGSKKGGKCFWRLEIGTKPTTRDSIVDNRESPTERRLLALKQNLDESKGKSLNSLWHSDFYIMVRYSRALKEYCHDVYDMAIERENSLNNSPFVRLASIEKQLKEKEEMICEQQRTIDELIEHLNVTLQEVRIPYN